MYIGRQGSLFLVKPMHPYCFWPQILQIFRSPCGQFLSSQKLQFMKQELITWKRFFLFNPFSFFLFSFLEDATLQHGLACKFSCILYRSIRGAVVFLRQWLILKYLTTVDRDVFTLLCIKDCLFILCLISVYPHFVYGLHSKQEKESYRNPRARLELFTSWWKSLDNCTVI